MTVAEQIAQAHFLGRAPKFCECGWPVTLDFDDDGRLVEIYCGRAWLEQAYKLATEEGP